jgi:hypothetical protein
MLGISTKLCKDSAVSVQQWFQQPCLYFVSLIYILIVSEDEKGTNKADKGDEGDNEDVDDEDSIEESERGEGTETPKKEAPTVDNLEEELLTMKIHKPSPRHRGPTICLFASRTFSTPTLKMNVIMCALISLFLDKCVISRRDRVQILG